MATRLNMRALGAGLEDPPANGRNTHSYEVSRRQVLGMAGAAAVVGAPALKAIEAHTGGSFSLVEGRSKAVFRYKGKDRWIVDTSQFGGAPKLRVSRSDGLIRLQLSGAKFPGTDISADFRAEIKEGISGWWMTLTLGMARFRTRVPFERWLEGREPAEATALMRSSSIRLGTTARAVIGGAGSLAFSPDWSVRLHGKQLARLEGLGSHVDSGEVVVRLLGRDEGSSLQGRVARRTLVSIARGKNMWDIDLPAGPEGSRLEAVDGGFDRVDIESRLSRLGHTERILVASSERDGDALLFFPAEDILGLDRKTFGMPVRNARYAMTFDPAHEERAVTAAFAAEPAWMHIDGCALGLGAVDGTSPFTLRHLDGKMTLQCKPSLLGVAGGLTDAVVEPQPLNKRTDVELVWGKMTRRRDKNTARLTVRHGRHDVIIPNYVASILRPEDLLALRLEYYGYDLLVGGGNPPELVRNAKTAIMIARFAPQNIAEQAFFEIQGSGTAPDPDPHPPGSENPLQPGYLQGNIAGPSRLAFDIPASVTTIPYTLAGVLDWSMFTQRVAPGALPPGVVPGPNSPTPIVEPPDDETSIESPYRLMISPNVYAYWNHTSDLVPGPSGEVELWHTRLGVRAPDNSVHDDNDPTDSDLRTIRAIWSPDYTTGTAPLPYDPSALTYYNPYRMSLDANDRYQIVRLTSDYNSTTFNNGVTAPYIPSPAGVERLALTTLGAWMNVRGYWSPDISGLEVTEWRHRATMGRDQYVRVVRAGYLWPFGHKASLIKITERKLVRTLTNLGSPGPIVAYLRQHFYILVHQPVKTYYGPHDAGAPSPPDYPGIGTWPGGYEGRQMPFKTVQITTLATPDIEDPNSAQSSGDFASPPSPPSGFGHEDAFWPIVLVNGTPTDFQWHLIGTDWDGNSVEFTMPLVYLGLDIAAAPQPPKSNFSNLNYIETQYQKSPKTTAQMHGAKIAFAPSAAVASGKGTDPAVTTDSVTFGVVVVPDSVADTAGDLPPDQPQFYPFFAVSQAEIPAIKHLLGKNAQSHVAVADPFLKNGFDGNQNKGEIFMHLVKSDFPFSHLSEQLPLVFGQGDTGQVVTPGTMSPNLSVAGLSRSIGPLGAVLNSGVSDFTSMANGSFDPTSFFDPNSLLGGSLPKLFGAVSLTDILNSIPDFTKDLNKIPGLKVMHDSKMIHVQFFWETDQIKQWPSGGPNSAIFAPWLINGDGTPTYPQGNPHYPGNVVTSTTPTPPPIPDISDDGSGSVNNSGDDPSHVWAATYIIGGNETIVGLGNTYDVSQGGGQSGDRKIKVTVDQNNVADGGMNIYRSKVGTAWPLLLVGTQPTISPSDAMGTGTFDYPDDTSDDSLGSQTPSTWTQFGIDLSLTIPLDGTDPTYSIIGEVAYASLQMDVIALPFISLTFEIQTGAKLTVKPQVGQVVFINSLQFINKLRDFLNAFSDPPFLDVEATQIDAGFTFSIPTISVGVLSLQNISLGAKIIVPYFGDSLSVGFNFCTKDNPFILTVYIFGGGGFVEIDVSPQGLTGLHIGFEFGADFAIDIVVASGSVHLMAGINYDYDINNGTVLTAFVDLGGSLEFLGIISISVDFHLELIYASNAGKSSLSGEASLTVEVKVVFFSVSVTAGPIRKTFAGNDTHSSNVHHAIHHGSDNSIPIDTIMQPDTWAAYTAAFAA